MEEMFWFVDVGRFLRCRVSPIYYRTYLFCSVGTCHLLRKKISRRAPQKINYVGISGNTGNKFSVCVCVKVPTEVTEMMW